MRWGPLEPCGCRRVCILGIWSTGIFCATHGPKDGSGWQAPSAVEAKEEPTCIHGYKGRWRFNCGPCMEGRSSPSPAFEAGVNHD